MYGFSHYVHTEFHQFMEPYKLENTKLIIDGSSTSFFLFEWYQRNDVSYIFGGDYNSFAKHVTKFFQQLINHNVDMLVVMYGAWELRRKEMIVSKLQKDIIGASSFFINKRGVNFYGTFRDVVFLDVIKKLRIKFLMCTYNAINVMATIAKTLDCPVLTGNMKFIIHRNNCVMLEWDRNKIPKNYKLDVENLKMFCPNKFVEKFPGLDNICLTFLPMFLSHNYLSEEKLHDILKVEKFDDGTRRMHQVKIEATLDWLSNHTLHSAANKVLQLMISTGRSLEESKKLIEDEINKYFTMSTYMLHHTRDLGLFGIDQLKIIKNQNKFDKFKFNDSNELISIKTSDINSIQQDDEEIMKKFEKSVPDWFMNDWLGGKFDPFIINLIEHETYIPWCQLEDFKYPSVYEISLPLIAMNYRLVKSCINSSKIRPLDVLLRDGTNVCHKMIAVKKYPIKLEDLRKLDAATRLNIINDVLEVENDDGLQDFPENWRLYVATIIFWIKQNSEPKKIRTDLYILLLEMLLTTFGNKLDSYQINKRNQKTEKLGDGNMKKKNDTSTVIDAVKEITHKDIVNMMNSLKLNQNIVYSKELRKENIIKAENFNIKIHNYLQFQICLQQSRNLNALLNFPYYQTIVGDFFNGSMMINLFHDITEQSTKVLNHAAEKLENSPNIFRVFRLLIEKVDSLLI